MYILTITFLLVLNTDYATLQHKKCCDADSYLRKNNSIYVCDKDDDKRLQIFTNETNYLKNAEEGTCVDTFPNITEYKISNHTVVKEQQIPVNLYPKCCPLGYFYHSVTHSCVWKENIDEDFITQNFVKVGLPQCRLIVDYKLTTGYRMELGNLYIEGAGTFREGNFCIDKDEGSSLIARGCHEDLSVCYDGVRCIHKCCPDGQSFVGGQKCVNTYEHGVDLSFTDRVNNSQAPFAIIHRYDCRIYILKKTIQFYLDTDGTFYAFINKSNSFQRFGIEDKSYCIEHIRRKTTNNFEFLMCFPEVPVQGKFVAARWAKIISSIFIVFTMAVYFFLPEMLNLFGKILMSYCVAMLAIFIFLIYAQFKTTDVSDAACLRDSFLSSYLSLTSFSWLNVMCFDIWWTFGTPKSFVTSTQKRRELKRFLLYSLYGWGLPAFLTLLTYLIHEVVVVPYSVRPILGTYKCFWERISGNYGMIIYYVTPLVLMEIGNLVLFLRTVYYCLKVKGEINRMNDTRMSVKERKKTYNVDKEQLLLILKLSVTMGLSFAFEVVSSMFNFQTNRVTEYIEIIWDTINCFQGVFIFLIFIFKVKVFRLCRNRLCTTKDRKISVSSLPTGTTQVSEPLTSKPRIRN
ncbi:hypothetical protein Zmor_013573 [Zophobas morio]|uniref:G-protein coupled receptors family 2 profile 2 domain-containing protein n=1 Tax=Zophobas morio TaxID=2755281 RepID=A0AA38MF85_9CUCU|nr:hypothetical protein Zmor_013573 [Zophobas morio]